MSTHFASLVTTQSGPLAAIASAFRVAIRAGLAVGRAIAHRREVSSLLELDDRLLKDVGLVRSDVLGALAEPLSRDPSMVLRLRSIDHRVRRRALEAHLRRMT